MNNFQLLNYAAKYGMSAWRQMRFIRQFLQPLVQSLCVEIGYHFNEKEKHKATFYYPLFNHIFNCENYLVVKGRKPNNDESKRLAIISVMATLYDDLIDEERWNKEQLFAVLYRTLPPEAQTKKVKLIFALDDALKKIWQPTPQYLQALQLAIEWQLASAAQLQTQIPLQEIMLLSREKCGNSSLLWASIMDENWSEADKKFIYQSGLVGQLVNDAMDAFKDREDGVRTYIFATADIAQATTIFKQECAKLHQLVLACDAPMQMRITTINKMATLHAFALVSLQHLQQVEKVHGKPLPWGSLSRKELITDMAVWKNKRSVLQHAKALAKLR